MLSGFLLTWISTCLEFLLTRISTLCLEFLLMSTIHFKKLMYAFDGDVVRTPI